VLDWTVEDEEARSKLLLMVNTCTAIFSDARKFGSGGGGKADLNVLNIRKKYFGQKYLGHMMSFARTLGQDAVMDLVRTELKEAKFDKGFWGQLKEVQYFGCFLLIAHIFICFILQPFFCLASLYNFKTMKNKTKQI
jgi:hypothetical protein